MWNLHALPSAPDEIAGFLMCICPVSKYFIAESFDKKISHCCAVCDVLTFINQDAICVATIEKLVKLLLQHCYRQNCNLEVIEFFAFNHIVRIVGVPRPIASTKMILYFMQRLDFFILITHIKKTSCFNYSKIKRLSLYHFSHRASVNGFFDLW